MKREISGRKIGIILMVVIAIIGITSIAMQRDNIYSTRAIMALSDMIDSDGRVSLCIRQTDTSNCWLSTDNSNKQLKITQGGGIVFTGTPDSYSVSSDNIIKYYSGATSGEHYAWYDHTLQKRMAIDTVGNVWVNQLTGNYVNVNSYVAGSYLFASQYISNNAGGPLTIDDSDGIKIQQFAGTGNAYVCVNSNGMLYRSAAACL